MLKVYLAPNGHTYQYDEGTQPQGFEPVDPPKAEPTPKATTTRKRRTTANKRADAPANK